MARIVDERIVRSRDKMKALVRSYGLRWPIDRVREYRLRMDDLSKGLETVVSHRGEDLKSNVEQLREKLLVLSPEAVLGRGYSITTRIRDDYVVFRSSDVKKDEELRIRFSEGSVRSVVRKIEAS